MNLNDYFNPVSLEKDSTDSIFNNGILCLEMTIHTPDQSIVTISGFTHAIIGVEDDKGSVIKGSALAPDLIRSKLYRLSGIGSNVNIIDLGNFKVTSNSNDTYFGLRDVCEFLISKNVIPIIIGGSQDISYAVSLAYANLKKGYTFTTVDYRPDLLLYSDDRVTSRCFLKQVFLSSITLPYFQYFNVGNQSCYLDKDIEDYLNAKNYELQRMGILRNNIGISEPLIRDTNFLSLDFNSVKHSDAPGQSTISPNGFSAEEICQIARFAGFSESLQVFGIFEINPSCDINSITSVLAAQVIWYYLEGYVSRVVEKPDFDNESFKKYIVTNNNTDSELVFYKSENTGRWWFELYAEKLQAKCFVSCSEREYLAALNNDIPERWYRAFKRLN